VAAASDPKGGGSQKEKVKFQSVKLIGRTVGQGNRMGGGAHVGQLATGKAPQKIKSKNKKRWPHRAGRGGLDNVNDRPVSWGICREKCVHRCE